MPAILMMSSDSPLPLLMAANCRRLNSTLNFDDYLLSTSPPGFEITAIKYLQCASMTSSSNPSSSYFLSSLSESKPEGRRKRFFQSSGARVVSANTDDETKKNNEQMTSPEVGREHRKSITQTSYYDTVVTNDKLGIAGLDLLAAAYSTSNDVTSGSLRHSKTEPDLSRKYNSRRKKVSFADDVGNTLEHIRFFAELPDMPPEVPRDVILHHEKLAADDGCRLELVFESPLPFENRAMLIRRVDKNLVSLETLRVAVKAAGNKSCLSTVDQLVGTVLVKNITFEKSVFVRCTFDNWVTFDDFAASFVRLAPCRESSSTSGRCAAPHHHHHLNGVASTVLQLLQPTVTARCLEDDLFEFRIAVPSSSTMASSQTLRAQLVVCFQFSEDSQRKEVWDNCEGRNYCIELRPKKIPEDGPILSSLKQRDHSSTAADDDIQRDLKGPYW